MLYIGNVGVGKFVDFLSGSFLHLHLWDIYIRFMNSIIKNNKQSVCVSWYICVKNIYHGKHTKQYSCELAMTN